MSDFKLLMQWATQAQAHRLAGSALYAVIGGNKLGEEADKLIRQAAEDQYKKANEADAKALKYASAHLK